jgi:chemotaxis protein methyltransferase CheR
MLNVPSQLTALPAKAGAGLTADNYDFLEQYIYRQTGIALGPDKLYLLESRLAPVLQELRLGSLNELCSQLRKSAPESLRCRIAECMTTHETSFFRDPTVYDALRSELIPTLQRRRQPVRSLRIWSAACSSGQEPYSLAIMLLEAGLFDWKIEILGTDLSSRILARAAAGEYMQMEVNRGLPAPLLVKYFKRAGLNWQIKEEVRRVVRFSPFDLRQTASLLGSFDLILCRNVMIYFDTETRKGILARLRGALNPGGYLLLGASETTFNMDPGFLRRNAGSTVAYQIPPPGDHR